MILLAIDTSSAQGLVALKIHDDRILEASNSKPLEHNQFILPAVHRLLEEAQLTLADVDYFAASVGPGSFVGTRLAVATIQGLAFGTGKPAIGVSHLALMALAANADEIILDAKMQGFYRRFQGQETFQRFTDTPPFFTPIPIFTGKHLIDLCTCEIALGHLLQDPSQLQPTYLHDESNWKKAS